MRKREHDRYWAAVCRAGIDGNLGMAGVAEWIHMGWGMGVSPEADPWCRRQRSNAETSERQRKRDPRYK
jgi:hypothetical protein